MSTLKMDEKVGKKRNKPLKEAVTVSWNTAAMSVSGTGHQSRQMTGASESGCCRQGGSPCSPKKFS